jgi:transcriptional regulator with XRE-family HTH domain
MAIKSEQLRMPRAALKLTTREVAEITGIDKSTIVRAEAGGKAYYSTITTLQALFEAEGIEFLDQIEGVAGPGVRLKWGVDTAQRHKRETGTGTAEDPALDAAPWDEEDDSVPPEIGALRAFWRERPEQWQALHEVSRLALLREMQLGSLGLAGPRMQA